jgi:hypothetical protein
MPGDKKRTFTIQASEIGFVGGEYKSDSPSKAAKKAAKRIFQLVSKVDEYKKYASRDSLKFILREKTTGSEKKTYFYETSVKNLKSPKYIKVKAPGNADADEEGFVKYPITKEIKVSACSESHVSHLF